MKSETRMGRALFGPRCTVSAVAILLATAPAVAYLPQDAGGWSDLTPAADARIVYVSSSEGSDANDGSFGNPVASLSRAQNLLRNNSADQMLLKRGDTWDHGFGGWMKRGRSESEPMIVGAYGDGARPLIQSSNQTGLTMWSTGFADSGGYNNLVFTSLHFQADWSGAQAGDNPVGIRIDRPGENLLFEDLYIEGYASNMVVQAIGNTPMGRNVQIRRSVLVDAFAKRGNQHGWEMPNGSNDPGYSGGSHAQGIYANRIDGLLIEENVLDHNGWNEEVEGAERTIFNHNLYIQYDNMPNVVVRGNIIANGASHGLQLRPGGIVENNLFVGNSLAAFIATDGGRAEDNVFIHGSNDTILADWGNYTGPRNSGLSMHNIEGSEALYNLFLHTPGGRNALTNLDGVDTEGNIVYNWGGYDWDEEVYGEDPEFLDPWRTLATYDALLGGDGSIESFLETARTLSRDNWLLDYTADGANDYFREGFSLVIPEPTSLALLGSGGLMLLRRRRA